jgi:uncharacterized protein YukE
MIMANINVDYGQAEAAVAKLNNNIATGETLLQTIQTEMDNLVQPGGGMYLSQFSPSFTSSLGNYKEQLTKMVDNLKSYGQAVTGLMQQLQQMDQGYAKSFQGH